MSREHFHPRLVEDTLILVLRGSPEETAYRRERNDIYRIEDAEERDAAFARTDLSWFSRLGLDAPLHRVLSEESERLSGLERILLTPPAGDRRQGAELYVDNAGRRSVVIAIRPGVLAEAGRALEFLRQELRHLSDILDPSFAYEPRLPPHPAGPAHDRLLQDRYRVLWNCSVDGRLSACGHLPAETRDRRRVEFARAFVCLGPQVDAAFERLFNGPRPTHPRLVTLAREPRAGFGLCGTTTAAPERCPLCSFPTVDLEPDAAGLPEAALRGVLHDFPGWTSETGLCRQCADLYRAREMSAAAESLLPGPADRAVSPPEGSLPGRPDRE